MDDRKYSCLSRIVFCLLVAMPTIASTSGCAVPSWMPFGEKKVNLGIQSPKERIAELRGLAKSAGRTDERSRHAIAAQLAESMRHEEDPLLRAETVRTLAFYPCEPADAILHAAMEDPEIEVREAACEAWGHRGDVAAVAALSRALEGDVEGDVRLAAARAMANCRGQEAVAALGNMLDDRDPAMQRRAVLSLKQVTGEDFGNDVNRWEQYVQGKRPEEVSVADRLLRPFHD